MCASTTKASLKFPLQDPLQQVASINTTIISCKLNCFTKQTGLFNNQPTNTIVAFIHTKLHCTFYVATHQNKMLSTACLDALSANQFPIVVELVNVSESLLSKAFLSYAFWYFIFHAALKQQERH